MFYKKKIGNGALCIIISFILISVSGTIARADVAPADVIDAAKEGLKLFKQDSFNLQFCSPEEWKSIRLGSGFEMLTISADQLLGPDKAHLNPESVGEMESREKRFHQLAKPALQWRFFVRAGDRAVALIYVGWTGNAWKCTGIGSAGIAGEMSEILRTYPESDGYTHRFIRIYEAKSDFVCLSRHQNRKDVPGYLPLLSARIALDINHGDETGKQLIYEDEFIDPLRSIVRKASGRSQ